MLATYTITSRAFGADLTGFDIAVVATDGSRHTMLGFRTMAEAEAWIEADRRQDRWILPVDDDRAPEPWALEGPLGAP